jgi:hypothetical protein
VNQDVSLQYDLVLVIGYFRSATAYLSVVKHLGTRFRIAIVNANTDRRLKQKTGEAEALFIALCRQWGANLISPGTPISCSLLVVQQFLYDDESAQTLARTIAARKKVGLMALATAGLDAHDGFLKQFGLDKVYVPSKRFSEFLIRARHAGERYEGVELIEVGLPFRNHPVFPEFDADYMILAPTLFSFNTEEEKHGFLLSILSLLDQIGPDSVVVYKPHNGTANDYFSPRVYRAAAKILSKVLRDDLLRRIAARLPRRLGVHASRLRTSILFERMLKRVVRMDALTSYADISVEAFLPGIRKGAIGGLSNTIWGSMYFGLPFYNCVDPVTRACDSALLKKTAVPLLELNLQYFAVPFCEGDLRKGVRRSDIFAGMDNGYDCVYAIEQDLNSRRVVTA